jgi:Outer membrane protein beta-barrel domain
MKALFLCLAVFFFHVCVSAQQTDYNTKSGFIVSNENDTIRGLIKDYTDLSSQISFKINGQSEFKDYTPKEVRAFQFEGGYYYQAVQLDFAKDERVFLMRLVDGVMSLYKRQDDFYIIKEKLEPVQLSKKDTLINGYLHRSKRYRGLLKYHTTDCPKIHQTLAELDFTDDDLVEYVTAYNKCVTPERAVNVTSEPTKMKIKVGLKGGAVVNGFNYFVKESPYYNENFQPQIGYMGGVWINFSYHDKLAIQPEINVVQKRAFAEQANNSSLNISLTFIQMPVSIYYFFPFKKVRPFVLAGGVLGHAVGSDCYREVYDSYNQKRTQIPLDIDRFGFGFRAGAGIYLKENIRIEYVWERMLLNSRSVIQLIRSSSHSIGISLSVGNKQCKRIVQNK